MRVYNWDMDNIKITYIPTGSKEEPSVVINHHPIAPHTCEHCKFWDFGWRFCNSNDVSNRIEANDFLVLCFANDFGCIFWEGKE
jgi:hypothetical protein